MKINKKSFMITLVAAMLVFTGCSKEKEETKQAPSEENQQDTASEEKQDDQSNDEKQQNAGTDFIVKAEPQKIEHMHGIGYPGNDEGLYVASHNGIKIYKDGQWFETTAEKHDYMGFQAVKDGFYSSGHPEEGSSLKNPLGLVKSTDFGKSLEKAAFYGESDFHFLSASYLDQTLYVINEQPNSELDAGVYVSKDNAKSWEQIALKGLDTNTLGMIAVHPDKGETFAMATKEGVFVSNDSGKTVKENGNYEMVTAAAFSKESLYISPVEDKKMKLVKLDEGIEGVELPIPTLAYDNPITYIAADYEEEGRIAFITILNDLYESTDGGQTWKQILVNGKIK
ncbi:MAG: hypothetical protein WB217_05005 [Mesobacillus sp.]|uniref:F510_1955 family glycosylhydrolase n=1 Tax=Mesobacillus sp. TaxID=2675271 RepID=UPI003C5FCEAB